MSSTPSHSQYSDVRLYIMKDSKCEVDMILGTALPRCEEVLFIMGGFVSEWILGVYTLRHCDIPSGD
jgi:hypothetical protein